jgi:hypothetical protein
MPPWPTSDALSKWSSQYGGAAEYSRYAHALSKRWRCSRLLTLYAALRVVVYERLRTQYYIGEFTNTSRHRVSSVLSLTPAQLAMAGACSFVEPGDFIVRR